MAPPGWITGESDEGTVDTRLENGITKQLSKALVRGCVYELYSLEMKETINN